MTFTKKEGVIKMSKKKNEVKEEAPQENEVASDVVPTEQQLDVNKLVEMYNNSINQLNQHKQLCKQYELTINTLTGRLIEAQRGLDSLQLQVNQLVQLTKKGGE